ncbi:MAG: hypothetical protein LBR32_03715 [Propionibacteriaceae bacterium]|nr:hypothetical protein [Propionibacteriaceae bacterium]
MTLHDCWLLAKKWWVLIVCVTLLGGVAGYAYSKLGADVKYVSTTRSLVSVSPVPNVEWSPTATNTLIQSLVNYGFSDDQLTQVADLAGLDVKPEALRGQLALSQKVATVYVSYTNRDAKLAQTVSDAAIKVFLDAVQATLDDSKLQVTARTSSSVEEQSGTSSGMKTGLAGAFAGFVLSCAAVLVLYLRRRTILSAQTVAGVTDLEVLADLRAKTVTPDLLRAKVALLSGGKTDLTLCLASGADAADAKTAQAAEELEAATADLSTVAGLRAAAVAEAIVVAMVVGKSRVDAVRSALLDLRQANLKPVGVILL